MQTLVVEPASTARKHVTVRLAQARPVQEWEAAACHATDLRPNGDLKTAEAMDWLRAFFAQAACDATIQRGQLEKSFRHAAWSPSAAPARLEP